MRLIASVGLIATTGAFFILSFAGHDPSPDQRNKWQVHQEQNPSDFAHEYDPNQ